MVVNIVDRHSALRQEGTFRLCCASDPEGLRKAALGLDDGCHLGVALLPMEILLVVLAFVISVAAYGLSRAARRTIERARRDASDGIDAQRRRMEQEKARREEERRLRETCPYCGARFPAGATDCKRCGSASR